MRRITSTVLLLALLLSGCGGVSKEDYDAVVQERVALQTELQELREEPDTVTVKLKGTFTATVRDLIPDYVEDGTTPRMAVITLFQSTPFIMMCAGDLINQLEIGETYVFEIGDQNAEITREEYETEDLLWDMEAAVPLYGLWIAGFREAEEGDYGLDSVHLEYELCE